MNARQILSQPRLWAASALLVAAGAANAGGVSISVGVNAPGYYGPGVSAVVSNGPVYYPPQPVYVQPRYYGVQPVVYAPPPPPPPRFRPFMGWNRWHHHGRAEAYAHGYREGYEQGYDRGNDDDRRGGWGHYRGR
jgi:hypothetical protein